MSEGKTDRERRLADALRSNLRRRKGLARERRAEDVAPADRKESEPDSDSQD